MVALVESAKNFQESGETLIGQRASSRANLLEHTFALSTFSSSSLLPRRYSHHELAKVDVCPSPVPLPPKLLIPPSLATVAGTQEPEYGPDAIRSVARQTESTPYTELAKDDMHWRAYQYTNVETQTFYVTADNGALVMVQVIYSNIA